MSEAFGEFALRFVGVGGVVGGFNVVVFLEKSRRFTMPLPLQLGSTSMCGDFGNSVGYGRRKSLRWATTFPVAPGVSLVSSAPVADRRLTSVLYRTVSRSNASTLPPSPLVMQIDVWRTSPRIND